MGAPAKKENVLSRFTATKERSPRFQAFIVFITLLITIFMITGFTWHMLK